MPAPSSSSRTSPTKEITQLTNTDLKNFREFRQDVMPMWGADGMIYFLPASATAISTSGRSRRRAERPSR